MPPHPRKKRRADPPPDSVPDEPDALPDGDVAQHPVHDEPVEDFEPDDYERQIEDVARDRKRARSDQTPVADRSH